MNNQMLPLAGIRVLDLGQYITGPFASVILAELGAEVLKIESPSGDPFRSWEGGPVKATFVAFNRGKRSSVLNLKNEHDQQKFLDLVREADVLVENFRPGVMEKFGLSYEKCRTVNARLIYCSITGFGAAGPYRDRPAFDGVAMAISGVSGLLTDPRDNLVRGPAIADTVTGYVAALSILAALQSRSASGTGSRIETSMLGALSHFLGPSLFRYALEGVVETPYTRPHNSQSFIFNCSGEKSLAIHLSAPEKFWRGLCEATDRHDLLTDDRFDTREGRRKHHNALRDELQVAFSGQNRDYWLRELERFGVPAAPVNTVPEVLDDPGLAHLGHFALDDSERGNNRLAAGFPIHIDGRPLRSISNAPGLGEHSDIGFG